MQRLTVLPNRIRENSLVRYKTVLLNDSLSFRLPSEFQDGTPLVYLGEIPNLPGRGIFASRNHRHIGYKITEFEEIPPEDLRKIIFDSTI